MTTREHLLCLVVLATVVLVALVSFARTPARGGSPVWSCGAFGLKR